MPNITNCGRCASTYEAESDEAANDPERMCPACTDAARLDLCGLCGGRGNISDTLCFKCRGSGRRTP